MLLPLPLTKLTAIFLLLLLCLIGTVLLSSRLYRRYVRSQAVDAPFIGLVIIALGLFSFFILWFGFAFEDTPVNFMRALYEDDKVTAFALLDADLQKDMDGLKGFSAWADNWQPESWFFWGGCSTSDFARSDGTGRFTNQQGFSVSFHLRQVEKEWLIQGIEFGSPGPTFQAGKLSDLACVAD